MATALALIALVAPSIHNSVVGLGVSRAPKAFRRPPSILKSLLAFVFSPKVLLKLLKRKSRLELESIVSLGGPYAIHTHLSNCFLGVAEQRAGGGLSTGGVCYECRFRTNNLRKPMHQPQFPSRSRTDQRNRLPAMTTINVELTIRREKQG
jgi:hypothetical protein